MENLSQVDLQESPRYCWLISSVLGCSTSLGRLISSSISVSRRMVSIFVRASFLYSLHAICKLYAYTRRWINSDNYISAWNSALRELLEVLLTRTSQNQHLLWGAVIWTPRTGCSQLVKGERQLTYWLRVCCIWARVWSVCFCRTHWGLARSLYNFRCTRQPDDLVLRISHTCSDLWLLCTPWFIV